MVISPEQNSSLMKGSCVSKSYIILPVHNKEGLIESVLEGIKISFSSFYENHLFVILDGCTDKSEEKAREYVDIHRMKNVEFFHMPNVHEITCLNFGLLQTRLKNPNDDDYVFTIQDDVILQEPGIERHFDSLYSRMPYLGYVSMRLGSKLTFDGENIGEDQLVESEYGHWKQLGMSNFKIAEHYDFYPKQLAIRSPTCVKWSRYKQVGFYDAAFAPCGYDCHDFSLRMVQNGYVNGVYALKFRSDVSWGGMRTTGTSVYNNIIGEVYEQNRRYLVTKHRKYLDEIYV
jgi:glycosyltransferase involved in cell wall biosynthesis